MSQRAMPANECYCCGVKGCRLSIRSTNDYPDFWRVCKVCADSGAHGGSRTGPPMFGPGSGGITALFIHCQEHPK